MLISLAFFIIKKAYPSKNHSKNIFLNIFFRYLVHLCLMNARFCSKAVFQVFLCQFSVPPKQFTYSEVLLIKSGRNATVDSNKINLPPGSLKVIDGGPFLHSVKWPET